MKISSSFKPKNNNTENNPTFKALPDTILSNATRMIGGPEQRLIVGACTAVVKPQIDLAMLDDDKKHDAALKSVSKAIAGTLTGVSIRAIFIKIANFFINGENLTREHAKPIKKFFEKINTMMGKEDPKQYPPLIRQIITRQFIKGSNDGINAYSIYVNNKTLGDFLKAQSAVVGSLAAIFVMVLWSNSKIDVPLTNSIQDFLSGIVKENKSWTKSLHDVIEPSQLNKKIQTIKKEIKDFIKNPTFLKKEKKKESK